MYSRKLGIRGRSVSAAVALLFLSLAATAVPRPGVSQEGKAPASNGFIGLWHATMPNGLRASSITVVPAGGGTVAGAFLGYDYDRRIDPMKPLAGDTPKVSMWSGATFINPKIDGDVLTFSMQLRATNLPPGAPEHFEVRGEMRLAGDGEGELKLFSPKKPEPMTLKLTRD